MGETLPVDHCVFRIKVVKTFLRAAVRLSKLEVFRELLEESAYSFTDQQHMSDMVPFIHSQEIATIKQELWFYSISCF